MKLSLVLAVALLAAGAVRAQPVSVGFVELKVSNGTDKPLTVGVWYPSSAPASAQPLSFFTQDVAPGGPVAGRKLPLIVMSHGTGSAYTLH